MNRINVVLHRPIYPRNIGMCARAMGNMDGGRLILVAPQCELTAEAKQGAAHAQRFLKNVTLYKSLQELQANEGEGVRIALSGREGRLKRPDGLVPVMQGILDDTEHPFHDSRRPIYLMFGPEDDGMSNEEMELCHFICRLPTYGDILSLNLSHAVLLALYITQTTLHKSRQLATPHPPAPMERENQMDVDADSKKALYYPKETIRRWLEALGFDLSARRVSIEKTLNRILLSRCPTPEELRIIDTVLQQTVRKLSDRK